MVDQEVTGREKESLALSSWSREGEPEKRESWRRKKKTANLLEEKRAKKCEFFFLEGEKRECVEALPPKKGKKEKIFFYVIWSPFFGMKMGDM